MVDEADEGVQTGPEDMSSEKFTLVLPALALRDVATAAAVVVRDGRGPVTCPTYSSVESSLGKSKSEAGSMRHNGPLGRNTVELCEGDAGWPNGGGERKESLLSWKIAMEDITDLL